ncbi:MAG: ATP-binding protein [Acidobacteria bacterium]|nr:ATP-binding protein [Acidobacteriota bacterium]MBI3421895.1 ATP-binding protein [Acidobacteriota bacterium]
MPSPLNEAFAEDQKKSSVTQTKEIFGRLIQKAQYVGEVYSVNYETALVQIHDYHRQQVGGIPSLSFLIATRVNPEEDIDYKAEDASVILLRVMDAAALPNSSEAERIRAEIAQRVSGETDTHWDDPSMMDAATNNILSFAGVKCRVIGTFYLEQNPQVENRVSLSLRFGSDLSNYYPNRGLKVYKSNGAALGMIVNYRDPSRTDQLSDKSVTVGEVRYASTNRDFQGVSDVPVTLQPADLLSQKTALFGMTRTGKSNTTKIVLKSVFELRFDQDRPLRIGQIVFDPNGEYANENAQDVNKQKNPSAIKNVWQANTNGKKEDVVTYGIQPHPNDLGRRLMLLNFFEENNLQIGKEMIDRALESYDVKFIENFCQVSFEQPPEADWSALTRYKRKVLVYRALLVLAGFKPPNALLPSTEKIFNENLLKAMNESETKDVEAKNRFISAAKILSNKQPSWAQLAMALAGLHEFMTTKDSGYQRFAAWYINERPKASGDSWADKDLEKLLEMFAPNRANGPKQLGKVSKLHAGSTTTDFADDIYNDLVAGKLVIIDQSSGDPEINKSSADRIMWHIFRANQSRFRQGEQALPEILVYVEEAHNILPAGSDMEMRDVWVRTAKEGAKYRIGMVYATQEVSSIQRNILKNTANWFIGHLNNTDETKELCKYYDFEDFEASIRRAQDRGFIRVKTLSNLFVVPIQVRKFEV